MRGRENPIFRSVVSPAIGAFSSERAHVKTRQGLHYAASFRPTAEFLERVVNPSGRFHHEALVPDVGFEIDNPLIVAGGWDKNGEAVKGLWLMGFGGVEVGTVVPRVQKGNPKPRQFTQRTEDGGIVALNRLGFNSPGMEVVAQNLEVFRESGIPIGVNIGKNKEDLPGETPAEVHAMLARRLARYASYLVINVSSPNTPGLRELQDRGPLTEIAQAVSEVTDAYREVEGRKIPVFVKIAPDLTYDAIDDVIGVVKDNNLAGVIATNTTTDSDIKQRYGWDNQPGGLSGDDLYFRRMSTNVVGHIYKQTLGDIKIIGVGGVVDAYSAYEKILAGACAVQVMTGIRSHGPKVARDINKGLVDLLHADGFKSVQEAVGADVV